MGRLSRSELLSLFEALKLLGYDVIAPKELNGVVRLCREVSGDELELDYVRLNNSPKDFLLPCRESLFRYKSTATVTSYGLKIRFPILEGPCPATLTPEYSLPKGKLAFFGIHPCMVNSIKYLDKVMLREPADPYYRARREEMFLAVLECEEGDNYCLCRSTGSYKIPEGYPDLLIRKSGDGFLVRGGSEKGSQLLSSIGVTTSDETLDELIPILKERYEFDDVDEASIDSGDASMFVDLCTLCSACTIKCPTCYCGDIEDKFSLTDPTNVERSRVWMSCQRKNYSMIAGGTVFLKNREARFKWRLKHKFPFSKKAYQMSGCIGCGNCIEQCPARIDFRKFIGRRVA